MSRRIELIAALIACALGLIWLLYEASALQSLWVMGAFVGSGAGRPGNQPISVNRTGLYFVVMAIVMVGIAIGAYLHTIQQLGPGLLLVFVAAAAATAGIGFYLIAPWQVVPTQFMYMLQTATYAWWFTPLGVLSVISAWVAAVAGLPIRQHTVPSDLSSQPARRRQDPEQVLIP